MALMPRADGMFALIDVRDLNMGFEVATFLEQEAVPADAEVIGATWAKTNNDGSPDRRFRDNRQIPVCRHGNIIVSSESAATEEYQFSNAHAAEGFAVAFDAYKKSLPATGRT